MKAQISEAFLGVVNLGLALGLKNLHKLPGCWEYQVDEEWWISLNGHTSTVKNSHGVDVPPFNVMVEFLGWPAGSLDHIEGILPAGKEDGFIAALKAASKKISD